MLKTAKPLKALVPILIGVCFSGVMLNIRLAQANGWLIESHGGITEFNPDGTIHMISLIVGHGGDYIYKPFTPAAPFTVSVWIKGTTMGTFDLDLRNSLPFAGSTDGANFEFGSSDNLNALFLLARNSNGWTWNTFLVGQFLNQWFKMSLSFDGSQLTAKVFDENGNLLGEYTASDMINLSLASIKYVGIGVKNIADFVAKDFEIVTVLSAAVDMNPDTLSLITKDRWVTAYIELPKGYHASDIDVSTIRLNSSIPVDLSAPTKIDDFDRDEIQDLMVKFDRQAVVNLISANCQFTGKFGTAALTITGKLSDQTPFQGSDTIKILPKS